MNAEHAPTSSSLLRGAALLLLASTLWGAAFIPQAISVEHMGPLWGTAIRFALAAGLSLPIVYARRGYARHGQTSAAMLGSLLFIAFYLQTAAIKIAPVWRVSLLTGTYAAFTPLLAPWFGHPRPTRHHAIGVIFALSGLFILSRDHAPGAVPFNIGDVMTLGHALLTSVHLLLVGRLARQTSARVLNAQQMIIIALWAVPVAALLEPAPPFATLDSRTWLAFGYLALFSSIVAFTAQIAGQKTASPSAAAVIMLLEAPIGAALAMVVFDEVMLPSQAFGAILLMGGVALNVRADIKRPTRTQAPRSESTTANVRS